LHDQREIHADGGRDAHRGTDPYRQRTEQSADDIANGDGNRISGGAHDHHTAGEPDGDGGANSHFQRGGNGDGSSELSMEEERDGDRRGNFLLLYNSCDNEFG
jgi:hypothetical protein